MSIRADYIFHIPVMTFESIPEFVFCVVTTLGKSMYNFWRRLLEFHVIDFSCLGIQSPASHSLY